MRAGIALLILSGVGWAQSNEKYFAQMESAIERGGIAAIHDHISVSGIADEPTWAKKICAAAVKSKLTHALRTKDELRAAAEKIRQIGVTCVEQHDYAAEAWSAKADGIYFLLRVERALGNETETKSWLDAVAALVQLHELEADDGAPLERAVKMLHEGSKAKGTDAAQLKAKEDEICAAGLKAYPGNGVFASNTQTTELGSIVALIEAKEYKAAKPRLAALLAETKDDTIYNDAVTVALASYKKLHVTAKYRSKHIKNFWGVFELDLPLGKRWKLKKDSILQNDRDGNLKRKFSFDYFKLNTMYYVGEKKFDGSNVKGMAIMTERDVLGAIVKVKRRSKIIKKRLNRKISGVQYFVIGGYDQDADFVRFHSYIWKGKERDWLTYRLWLIEWADYEGLDPEAKFVLGSLRERKYKPKK